MNRFIGLLIVLSFSSIVLSGDQPANPPLVFDPFTWDIIDRENPKEYYSYVAACPALDEKEIVLNDEFSFDNKALFVRNYDKKYDNVKSVDCDSNIKLSVVHRNVNGRKTIEIGYEVYYNKSNFHQRFETFVHTEFRGDRGRGSFNAMNIPSDKLTDDTPRFDKLGFIWVNLVSLKFNHSSWSVTSLSYEVDGNASELNANCDSDALSHIIYHSKNTPNENYADDLKKLYSPDNQKKIFQDAKLPNTLGEDCRIRHNCLKKYNITPYQLESSSGKNSCSDLTSIPIWYELNESLLNYLNKFLSVIARVANGKFFINEGILDPVTLSLKNKGERVIYLNPDKKILPAPKLLYKIITYETYDCEIRKRLCWFSIIIVIQNDPKRPTIDRDCSFDTCENWGWDSIQYGSTTRTPKTKSNYIYCCSVTGGTLRRFNYQWDKKILVEDLKLTSFPTYNGKDRDHLYENRQEEFEKEMTKLLIESQKYKTGDSNSELGKD